MNVTSAVCALAIGLAFARGQAAPNLDPIPDTLIVLTLDDSKASHYTVVRPLQKKYASAMTQGRGAK